MKLKHLHLHAHFRAICIMLALFLVPNIVQADDVYLLTSQTINGTTGKYEVPSNHKFSNTSGTVYTYTIKFMPTGGFYFRIGVNGLGYNLQPYKNDDPLNINDSSSYNITEDCHGSDKAWKVSYKDGEYSSLTITVDLSTTKSYVKITGVKSSSGGGGSSTTTCAPGLYIYGEKYGKTGDQYIYKLQRSSDKQYYISLNAINGAEWSNVQSYENGQGIDNNTISTIGQTFHLVYVDANGNETAYYPSTNGYGLSGTDPNVGSSHTKSFSTTASSNWTIGTLNTSDLNGGIYNFYVNTDVNGVPQNWYYERDETRIVAYEVNSSTNTTDAYLYGRRANTTSAYNKNFFGMVSFVKDGYLTYLFGGVTYGRRKNSNSTHDMAVAAYSPNAMQFDKDGHDTGIYSTEFNPTRDYIISGDKKPTRIFVIGSAINPELSDTYTTWDPSNAVEMTYDSEEGCYKTTITLNKDKQFRFLLDHNTTGGATSLSDNFGEDANTPGNGGDTDYNNKVEVESSSNSGKNIVFNPETKTYVIRFYVERKADKTGFEWTNVFGIYRYTIEEPAHMSTTITPPTATVAYGASLTPKVDVNDPNNGTTRTYAYTTDGSDPTIDPTSGEAKGTTKIVTYTPDAVIPTSDLGTFYMAPGNVLTFIDNEGKTTTLTGTSVTVKAQAVQTVTEGSKYSLDGNVATGNYTFKEAGVQPGSNYTISVTNNETISVNKATATVSVTNSTTDKDDGVDVYYTTDGSDPLKSTSARLVRDRKVTVYALPGEVGKASTIKVAIPGTTASASCTYDITYSTSEGGYLNYLNNSNSQKTLGGDGHVVVYVQPYTSNESYTTRDRQTYVYAYEKKSDGTYASLTPAHRILSKTDETTVNKETWYYLDLEPASTYKEVNVLLGYYDTTTKTYKTSDATVANACQDMFIKFDVATGQLTDVTHAYTGDHFYTTVEGGTKTEAANPVSGSPFFYAQVPLTWTSNGNSVKVFSGDTELSGATVTVQNSAETSDLSSVCKISVPTTLADKTDLTLKPYKGTTASNDKFTITYQNGGYYFYESASHYSTTAPLVFAADTESDADHRSYGHRDINHVTQGDKTNYLANSWTYSPELESKTATITDNWNGASSATVNVIPANTTISQTVTGLTASTPYTVQMIVRGQKDAKGTLSLNDATEGTATDSKSFAGYDAAGTITTDGRVEALLSGTSNGWQKLEATANATDEGKLTISLTAANADMELSDVTLLENANTKGHVWTTVPTNSTTTEYFLTDDKHSDEIGNTNDSFDRYYANSFSFFDRGVNYNAVVYVSDKTAVGMSPNTYNIAVPITTTGRSAKAYSPRRAPETAIDGDSEAAYTGHKLALYDNTGSNTSEHPWRATVNVQWNSFSYDRNFYGTSRGTGARNTICLPFAMDLNQIKSIFGENAKIYTISSVDKDNNSIAYADSVGSTQANVPYVLEISGEDKNGVSTADNGNAVVSKATPTDQADNVDLSSSIGTGQYTSYFVGVYNYTNIGYNEDKDFLYYCYDADRNGIFNILSNEGAVFKPFRAYLKVRKSTTSTAKLFYLFRVNDGSTTSIDKVATDTPWAAYAPVYNLQGQMVRKAGEKTSLPKGVYIKNGRKFIQK